MEGAVDLTQCPTRTRTGLCKCGACLECGFPKHSAIHGPFLGQPPGSKPFGHQYVSTYVITPKEPA
jgi:hypothetical protein